MTEEHSTGSVERFIAHAADIVGTAGGALIGTSTGDPAVVIAGAVGGSVFAKVVGDLATRSLSDRQEQRASTVVVMAFGIARAKETMGEHYRDDDFFDGSRSDGDEFIEGVLRVAMDEYEERKLPYLAHLLANVCFMPTVDTATAHFALHRADEMSWIEMQMLGLFWAAEEEKKYVLPDHPKVRSSSSWYDSTVNQTYVDLSDKYKLISHPRAETVPNKIPTHNLNLSSVTLTNAGRLLAGLMELQSIPQSDLAPMHASLSREPVPGGD